MSNAAKVGTDLTTRRFNHDLLVREEDQGAARERWPAVDHALIHPELIDIFLPHETRAKRLKRTIQWFGSIAVLVMLFALLGSSWHLYAHNSSSWLRIIVEMSAILGLLVAIFVSRYGPLRRRWLRNRFVTEILRVWHFRYLISTEFDRSGTKQVDRDRYVATRAKAFAAFIRQSDGSVGEKMSRLITKREDPLGTIPVLRLPSDKIACEQLLEAYRVLRLDHQIEFAEYKLSADDRTLFGASCSLLVQVANLLAGTTLLLAMVAAVLHLFLPLNWLPLVAVSLAIAGVAVRAWRDGLGLEDERERYSEMLHRLESIKQRWDKSSTQEQLSLASELEHAAVEELRSFLRTHDKAQFLF